MALINCPECGKEISDKAAACPNCGLTLKKKFCQHCGEQIDVDCVVCPACGKQVKEFRNNQQPIYINNSASSSASSSSSSSLNARYRTPARKLPWYLSLFWIFILGLPTGGLYWIIGIILRVNWKSHN